MTAGQLDTRTASTVATPAARLARLRWALVILAPSAALLASAGMLVAGLPDYGRYVATEQTPMTWLQSLVLAASALVAALLGARVWQATGRLWPWVVLAAGFAELALDERFALHERLRDQVLADHMPQLLPWGSPGDILLPLYAVAGLLIARSVLRSMGDDGVARRTFLVGLVAVGVAVAVDTIDVEELSFSVELAEQTGEEVLELLGQSILLLSLLLTFLGTPTGERETSPAAAAVTP